MARETKAQRAARLSDLLGEYDRLNKEKRKIESDLKTLKGQLDFVDPGTYGDWVLSFGTPRTIMDQPKVRDYFQANDLELPVMQTAPPISVNPKAGK